MSSAIDQPDPALGWASDFDEAWADLDHRGVPGRVSRLDRGWSTVIRSLAEARGAADALRVRNIGADVAVGDWVVPSDDGERVDHVLERRSAFTRRASFDGMRAVSHTLAANIDVVFLVHALGSPPSPRRLERELVLAFDSGAEPVVVLTKTDLVDDPEPGRNALTEVSLGVPVLLASGRTSDGVDVIRGYADGNRTLAFLGASGVGKSTLVNALIGVERQATSAVREGDQRGRHTTVAAERHAGRESPQPVAVRQRHRTSLRRRLRPDGSLPLPRLQARSGTGLRGAGSDRRGPARPGAAPEPRTADRGGGCPRRGAARPRQGGRQTSWRTNAPAGGVRVPRSVSTTGRAMVGGDSCEQRRQR
jgi:ribosome small subunit-dependent GTPase A